MISIGVIMNPIESINPSTDSTLAMMDALQINHEIIYIIPQTLHMTNHSIIAKVCKVEVFPNKKEYYKLNDERYENLANLTCVLFRIDPPVNTSYIQMTLLLDCLVNKGTMVINSPQTIRDFNEKILGTYLNTHLLPSMISKDIDVIQNFIDNNNEVVLKPLNLMGGIGVTKVSKKTNNLKKIIENLTNNFKKYIMVQKYLDEIDNGDTRILITNGEIHPDVLVRYPKKGDFRANLSYGGKYAINRINPEHTKILVPIAKYLKNNGVYFSGVDMIGNYITEINITSPTGIQQIETINKELRYEVASHITSAINDYHADIK